MRTYFYFNELRVKSRSNKPLLSNVIGFLDLSSWLIFAKNYHHDEIEASNMQQIIVKRRESLCWYEVVSRRGGCNETSLKKERPPARKLLAGRFLPPHEIHREHSYFVTRTQDLFLSTPMQHQRQRQSYIA